MASPHWVTLRHTSLGLLWTSDQPDEETSTQQHNKLTTDDHPYPSAGFVPANQGSDRVQTHALDRGAAGSGRI
jgi:hypothetical protein